MMWPWCEFRMQVWNTARWNTERKNSPSAQKYGRPTAQASVLWWNAVHCKIVMSRLRRNIVMLSLQTTNRKWYCHFRWPWVTFKSHPPIASFSSAFLGDRLQNGSLYAISPLSVCPVCLSVLYVCDIRALWPNGWTDQDETWLAGRPRPWPQCVRWGPSSPPQRGTASPTNFWPIYVAAKWLHGSKCHLVWS